MPKPTISTATTHWEGNLFQGKGQTELTTSGVATFDVSWAKRAEAGQGNTNPEELLAASLATITAGISAQYGTRPKGQALVIAASALILPVNLLFSYVPVRAALKRSQSSKKRR